MKNTWFVCNICECLKQNKAFKCLKFYAMKNPHNLTRQDDTEDKFKGCDHIVL